jgi:NCAIR mutase (PurE)-related protein
MDKNQLKKLLTEIKDGTVTVERAMESLSDFGYKNLDYAKVDNHRTLRTGFPEIIFCQNKTVEHVTGIVQYMIEHGTDILATRATKEMFTSVQQIAPEASYHELARTITIKKNQQKPTTTHIAIITAGTSDIPVAEEAAITAEFFNNRTERYYDVGVAGIHRFYDNVTDIRKAKVLVVAAGMEGALPSIVGGMVDKPVIAVPTSVGYGASFNGVAALLGMLTSCASGVSVVNIDNGFGAGYLAGMINNL